MDGAVQTHVVADDVAEASKAGSLSSDEAKTTDAATVEHGVADEAVEHGVSDEAKEAVAAAVEHIADEAEDCLAGGLKVVEHGVADEAEDRLADGLKAVEPGVADDAEEADAEAVEHGVTGEAEDRVSFSSENRA